jgi:D-xylose 1-dehydrogenase (NADP+, D-xylono-1,5-lactone-forming)
MPEQKIRWGILSTAKIARRAVNGAIRSSSNGELRAVASRDGERARAFAREEGIPTAHGSYHALLDDDTIDAVYVPLPNSLHKEWTIRAVEAGKHVLCEKPLALDAAECREMVAVASANGVKLMEAFMYRFHPRTEKALEMVRSGAVGELKQIRSSFTFLLDRPNDIRWDRELGGGALLDLGCYCVNVSRAMAGREPVEVRAMANLHSSGVDRQMAGSLRFEDGLLAHFDCALTMARTQVYHVLGTDGHLRVMDAFVPGTEDTVIERFDLENELTKVPVAGADQYRLMVEHFAGCVLTDGPVRHSAEDAELNLKVIEALHTSARKEGAVVAVG